MKDLDVLAPRRFKHVFLDAEGTLYVPKNGRSRWEFWADPSPAAAVDFFELDRGVAEALREIRDRADTLCIVSMNQEPILEALLDKFGIRGFFDEVIVTKDKGRRIAEYLVERGLKREDAVMVGDMPYLDLYPARAIGVEAILVDRYYNRNVRAERIGGVSDLPCWLRMADLVDSPRSWIPTLDEYCRDLHSSRPRPGAGGPTKSLMASPG